MCEISQNISSDFKKVPVRYRPNAASGSVAVGGVRIISALSEAVFICMCANSL